MYMCVCRSISVYMGIYTEEAVDLLRIVIQPSNISEHCELWNSLVNICDYSLGRAGGGFVKNSNPAKLYK